MIIQLDVVVERTLFDPGGKAIMQNYDITFSKKHLLFILLLIIHYNPFLLGKSSSPLTKQRQQLIKTIQNHHQYNDKTLKTLNSYIQQSSFISQGNPKITKHPVSSSECYNKLKKLSTNYNNPSFNKICKSAYMAPLYDPLKEKPSHATTCIDQFEFPNIPCEYPLVWVRANEASMICNIVGKRLCDTHEWESACAGKLVPPDYAFKLTTPKQSAKTKQRLLRKSHNQSRKRIWSYGNKQNHSLCATDSTKSSGCNKALQQGKSVWQFCGSNTYPAGFFPQCKSSLDVYDQHGNAAEHMNLPLSPEQLTKKGGSGHTEMKGSWFVFQKYSAHQDDCRWRAPYWHGSEVNDSKSHHNYHLGFRCCKDIK